MKYISHPKHVSLEYNQITPHIYLGTNQCCETHFVHALKKKGIDADISLEKEHLDNPKGVGYFLWLPVKDKKAPSQNQLSLGARMIEELVNKKIKVYVHCKRGHGRSPTLLAAYFISQGMTATQALKKIRGKRRIHPTREQIKSLKKFEKRKLI